MNANDVLQHRLAELEVAIRQTVELAQRLGSRPNPISEPLFRATSQPSEGDIHVYRSAERHLADNRKEEAFEALFGLATKGTTLWEAYNDLGCLLLEAGNPDAAFQAFQLATGLEKNGLNAFHNLVAACASCGEVGKALSTIRSALQRAPYDPDLTHLLADVIISTPMSFDDPSWISPEVAALLAEAPARERLFARLVDITTKVDAISRFVRISKPYAQEPAQGAPTRFPPLFEPVHQRARPSVMLMLPPASGSNAVSRIIPRCVEGAYAFGSPEYQLYGLGQPTHDGVPGLTFQPEGQIYYWFTSQGLSATLNNNRTDLSEFNTIVVFRDPRDVVISLFYLIQDPMHLEMARQSCSAEVYEQSKQYGTIAAAKGVDAWALEHIGDVDANIRVLMRLCESTPPHQVAFLSYALLCEDFPHFVSRLTAFLEVTPPPEVLSEILRTEDIKLKDQLTSSSLTRTQKASPTPGRHKRELRPETIQRLNEVTAISRRWLASMEEPFLRHLYAD